MEKNEHSDNPRAFFEKLEFFLLDKGFEQGYQLDKSLLTLSAGALLLSITFVGTLSETKHCLVSLFVAWASFIVSIIAVIFAMRSAQLRTHRDAIEAANNLERASQMTTAGWKIERATLSAGRNKTVAWLNSLAILGFVLGVLSLCWFVGINLLAESVTRTVL